MHAATSEQQPKKHEQSKKQTRWPRQDPADQYTAGKTPRFLTGASRSPASALLFHTHGIFPLVVAPFRLIPPFWRSRNHLTRERPLPNSPDSDCRCRNVQAVFPPISRNNRASTTNSRRKPSPYTPSGRGMGALASDRGSGQKKRACLPRRSPARCRAGLASSVVESRFARLNGSGVSQ